ncbi:putative disease resistance protein At3g14460 [Quercus lobata]|uniref:putative disease resistance protein At3g14460 n=1 Tax=Quercus lobata TaxID=97700 RepID=UPI0012483D04|nr:putative disease resistance protein At3g14460 [Quercus lobata]
MGGVGKTTLAQLLYNKKLVVENFDVRAWVCVSQEFDLLRITRTILEAVSSSTGDTNDLDLLQVRLNKSLVGKKFLIVLDDIWNENYLDWEVLRTPFKSGAKGSKVILTTRNETVASVARTVQTYHLKPLTDEDCWLLFAKHAFGNRESKAYPNLELIGKEIVQKCNGLPLAAKTLGGLLRLKLDPKEWVKIVESNIWNFSDCESNILPALRLSYLYLPSHLKPCFAYCSIFPKNYKFRKEELVLLWMAEDFLLHPKRENLEEVGVEYFNDLVSRSFFRRTSGRSSCYAMHDLLNDLALFVSGEFCFRMEADNSYDLSGKTRYFSYSRRKFDAYEKFEAFHGAKGLRSFLPSSASLQSACLGTKVVLHLLPELRSLRVLSLSKYWNLTILPDSIGNLKHLRYLDLSRTAIKVLPDSVCTLYNLQTLLLSFCYSLTELPANMGWLVNLRHLDISETNLIEMPMLMGRLKSLQTLTSFILGKKGGSGIKELGEFQQLKGSLSVLKLENVVDARDALEANLKDKLQLNELILKWGGDTNDSKKDRDILDHLQPHANLRRLTIENYGGTILSDWLGHASCNIVSVQIRNCKYCLFLPPFGQLPSLQNLSIEGLDGVVTIGSEFYGTVGSESKPFASLQTLRFKNMLQLQEWLPFRDDNGGAVAFPRLRQLFIQNCCNLTKGLPDSLFSLKALVIEKCQQLVASLPRVPVIHELKLQYCNEVLLNELPPQVLKFTISGYDASVSLPMGNNHCLEELDISDCPSLRLLPSIGEADALKSLSVNNCGNLVFPMHRCYPSLESLCIRSSFDSLVSFPLELFPKLNHLDIHGCQNLHSFSFSNQGRLQHLLSLRSLQISNCSNFVSFPEEGLPAPNLTLFRADHCNNLKALPGQMHTLLASLQDLSIRFCPELESFPDGGLPSSLNSLEIHSCEKLIASRLGWGLQALPSLRSFCIRGFETSESFPERELLPLSLTSLEIWNNLFLKSLNGDELLHLIALKHLGIGRCPNLHSMPEDGLPTSLSFLSVTKCPLLKNRCLREKGEDWPKIAHVPVIKIDGKVI